MKTNNLFVNFFKFENWFSTNNYKSFQYFIDIWALKQMYQLFNITRLGTMGRLVCVISLVSEMFLLTLL